MSTLATKPGSRWGFKTVQALTVQLEKFDNLQTCYNYKYEYAPLSGWTDWPGMA